MFSCPELKSNELYPSFPTNEQWQPFLDELGVEVELASDPDKCLRQLTRWAVGWVEGLPGFVGPEHEGPLVGSRLEAPMQRLGLTDAIDPPGCTVPDFTLIDGGNIHRYRIRLQHAVDLQNRGFPSSKNLIIFGGQSLWDTDDTAMFVRLAESMSGHTDPWVQEWLEQECAKPEAHPDPWRRPFATEREIGLLCLLERFGAELRHTREYIHSSPVSIHPSVPVLKTAANEFDRNGQRVMMLNTPAKIREHAGRKLPLDQARPIGRTCFNHWLTLDNPPYGSEILFLSHAPNIYRSWLDMRIKAVEVGRDDLKMVATGAALEPNAPIKEVLKGLGDLIINYYNIRYEGGVESPETEPFAVD